MLPDVISQLSSDHNVDSPTFRSIIKFLFKHVDKDVVNKSKNGRFGCGSERQRDERLFVILRTAYSGVYGLKCARR